MDFQENYPLFAIPAVIVVQPVFAVGCEVVQDLCESARIERDFKVPNTFWLQVPLDSAGEQSRSAQLEERAHEFGQPHSKEEVDAAESTALILNVIWVPTSLLIVFFASSRLTQRLQESRRLLAPSSIDVRNKDARTPILLLRSFLDEGGLTAFKDVTFLSLTRFSVRSLEEHLTDRLWRFGPVVAFGLPGELVPPVGAAREYLNNASEQEWKSHFEGLSRTCGAMVLILGKTDGVRWEFRRIIDLGLQERLLLVIPPWLCESEWREFCDSVDLPEAAVCVKFEDGKSRLLGFRVRSTGFVAYQGSPDQFGFEALSVVGVAEIFNEGFLGL